ncbi:hypothetical protein MG290_01830 [Flavobacterium sp. CBA20B-1]|uniref:hypothetical protein n=1 Tax=unclassified Flavobacterium TaxID=196869 RepID=UPI002223FB02|nr:MULTISPECIES: hypothetical protein [unclassified Flavobacterium]WCM42435.1 hypothetical protein MG290_01830 [Flavobacterium sp. CBA20B-1]
MADNSEFKHTRHQIERKEALKAQEIARKQTAEKIKAGAKYVSGPIRSMILKK